MKKQILIFGAVLFIAGLSMADVIIEPEDNDELNLDHYYAYTWGVDLGFSTLDNPITEMYVSLEGIANWDDDPYDTLYINFTHNNRDHWLPDR